MTRESPNSHSVNDLSRCQHRTRTGRRCRFRVADPDSPLCFRHFALSAAKGFQLSHQTADLSPELVGQLTEFKSAVDINHVLSNLLLLISRDRIAPRRASVVAYTCNLLLQSLPHIDHELNPPVGEVEEVVQVIVDGPRPKRHQEVPQCT
jgi:hypothetical protein